MIASGDCVYKMDYNKVLEYHIAKRADVTVVCTTCDDPSEIERFGVLRMNETAGLRNLKRSQWFLLIIQFQQVSMLSEEDS